MDSVFRRLKALMAVHPPSSSTVTRLTKRSGGPAEQAFLLLRTVFTVAPIAFGLDKFANLLTDWPTYLAPFVDRLVPARRSRRCTTLPEAPSPPSRIMEISPAPSTPASMRQPT
jgi:hypothetical protein